MGSTVAQSLFFSRRKQEQPRMARPPRAWIHGKSGDDVEENGSGTGKVGVVLQGFSFAEQVGQRPLDQYLLNRHFVAHLSKGLAIHQPPETQFIEKDDFLFILHGQHSFEW
jgi:hypothetical protein